MNDNLPTVELSERFTLSDMLADSIEGARKQISSQVGYELEIAGLETFERDGRANLRVYWRRKKTDLHIVN